MRPTKTTIKWHLIAQLPKTGAELVDVFDSKKEAEQEMLDLQDPECLDVYFKNITALGGYLRIEDENGNF